MEKPAQLPRRKPNRELKDRQCVFRIKQSKPSAGFGLAANGPSFRPRAPHKKSRLGCKSCKKRHVKCDETRPICQRCKSHGISCDYTPASVNPVSPSSFNDVSAGGQIGQRQQDPWQSTTTFTMSISVATTALDTLLGPASCHPPNISHATTLHHYTTSAYATIGSPSAQLIALNAVPFIATRHPYLMHAVLGFSALHLRHLLQHSAHSSQYTLSSYHHWSRALSLFQSTLSNPGNLNSENMDALLSTCLLVDIMSMSVDEGASSASSASFISSTTHHLPSLDWLAVHSGFKTLLTALDLHLHSSVWLPVFTDADDQHGTYLDERPGRIDLAPRLADLCAIGPHDTAETNPYHTPLRLLTPLLRLYARTRSRQESMFTKLITFPARIRPDFRDLLADRDHRALLLMACWFGMAAGLDEWWLRGRAIREGRALCEFLRQNAGPEIGRLVAWVGRACCADAEPQTTTGAAGKVGDGGGLDEWVPWIRGPPGAD